MNLKIHYLDAGQGDCILIQLPDGKNMLIDAGHAEEAGMIAEYLRIEGVDRLDYVIGTHSHADHVGGLDVLIDSFNIGELYLPDNGLSHTESPKDALKAANIMESAQNKGVVPVNPEAGTFLFDTSELKCSILAPKSREYERINDYSIVVRLVYKKTAFLFMGDAEAASEKELLDQNIDLTADVLKVGHHGSFTSSSDDFIDRVKPLYAVITCGMGKNVTLPHRMVMERLRKREIIVYRMDECGKMVCTSDGESISFDVLSGSYRQGTQLKENDIAAVRGKISDERRICIVGANLQNCLPKDWNIYNGVFGKVEKDCFFVVKQLEYPLSGIIEIETEIRLPEDHSNGVLRKFQVRDEKGNRIISTSFQGTVMYLENMGRSICGIVKADFVPGRWYKLRFVIDTYVKKLDLHIDGMPVEEARQVNLFILTGEVNVESIEFLVQEGFGLSCVGNVKIDLVH